MGEAESSATLSTPLDALGVLASQEVEIGAGLRHVEIYTMRGLLTILWHATSGPPADGGSGAVVACGGRWAGCSLRLRASTTASASTWLGRGRPCCG
jgi:hypothetical protein